MTTPTLSPPYYDREGITIYHGDCREILPTLGRFDLLLTDPPYKIHAGRGGGGMAGTAGGGIRGRVAVAIASESKGKSSFLLLLTSCLFCSAATAAASTTPSTARR